MTDKLGADADTVTEKTLTGADDMTPSTSKDEPAAVAATESLALETPSVAAKEECNLTNIEDLPILPSNLTVVGGPPSRTESSSKPLAIGDLPNELLSHILGFLDIERPSVDLHDEPTFHLTDAETTDLKASSCVSKRWRQSILPLLFKHARFVVREAPPKLPVRSLSKEIRPFMEFAKKNMLLKIVTTYALVVKEKRTNGDGDIPEYSLDVFQDFWHSIFKIIDPVELLIIANPAVLGRLTSCRVNQDMIWNFDCPCHYLRLRRPTAVPTQPTAIEAVGHSDSPITGNHEIVQPDTNIQDPIKNLPENLLKREPSAAAFDDDLGSLDSQTANLPESSNIDPDENKVAEPDSCDDAGHKHYAQSSTLFNIRPWSSILLNEGSFIKMYRTYEFWNRRAPSILSDLVGADEPPFDPVEPLISPTIREMSYIGIFPTASHFCSLTRNLPRLNSLYVQLVPRNNIMEIPSKMFQVESSDLWMERNSCYALLMRELFNAPPIRNYKYLEAFESGDAADKPAWNMALEYVKRAGNGWKVVGDGVFERNKEDLAPEPEEGAGSGGPSSFEGALIRWAWNGTTKLPVSAQPLYANPLGPVG